MSVHFKHLAEMKTLLETKTLTNDGILELDTYKERSEVCVCVPIDSTGSNSTYIHSSYDVTYIVYGDQSHIASTLVHVVSLKRGNVILCPCNLYRLVATTWYAIETQSIQSSFSNGVLVEELCLRLQCLL